MQTSQQHTCFLSLLYTATSCSEPRCCFKNASRIETIMPVSNISRKTMKNTKLEFKESGWIGGQNRSGSLYYTWNMEDVHHVGGEWMESQAGCRSKEGLLQIRGSCARRTD